jgi:hypothetical protein
LSKDKENKKTEEVEFMFILVWLNKKGQVKKELESNSSAMLKLWVVQNVTSGYAVILDENYNIVQAFESKNKSMAMPIEKEEFPFNITVG